MTHKLRVNPNAPQSWEIHLKAGSNRIGRREDNDHQIDHPSISGSHCEILVTDHTVQIKDLGSTNGTYVDRSPISEALLLSGQHVQIGDVDMMFESLNAATATESAPAEKRATTAVRVRLSRPEPPQPPPLVPDAATEEREIAPAHVTDAATCKSHPKSPARYFCQKCRTYFCDLCVMTRPSGNTSGKFCRACGSQVAPVKRRRAQSKAKSFFSLLPGTVIYPFRGSGLLVLIMATLFFTALSFISGGIFGIVVQMIALGYLFSFMQNIIHATAAEEAEMPELPAMDELFSSCFRLLGTIGISYGPAIGLAVAKLIFDMDMPVVVIVIAAIYGCLYFPMAFLAVAIKDTVFAANPLIVVPAILRVPLEYLVTAILLTGVFAARFLGDSLIGYMADVSTSTRDMSVLFLSFGVRAFWAFASVYLLTVNMRILGLLYLTKKDRLDWSGH